MKSIMPNNRAYHVRFSIAVLALLLSAPVVLDLAFPLPQEKLNPPSSTLVLDKDGNLLRAFLAPDDMWRLRVTDDEISPLLKQAVLTYEDRYFRYHPGVNPVAVARATIANVRAGKVVQGGSTITMQVARLIEPKRRTFLSKIVETFRALQLETHYSKDEILNFYFNLAPYGGNIVGVGAASRVYFDKPPDKLSPGEAALLAAIPNSPNRHRPDIAGNDAEQARNRVIRLLQSENEISAELATLASGEPVPVQRFELPFEAPHLAEFLRSDNPQEERLYTTIDASLQDLAEAKLSEHLRPLSRQGINNGAVVIIDNRSKAVLALVGSQGFFADSSSGQVNGALAPRSPGSALKPFVYAMALDKGLVSPRSLLNDVPVTYGGYSPVNYDDKYNGAVTVEDALVRSLNVPAINLAAKVGGEEVYSTLKRGGISTLNKPWAMYGLPIVLGGCEVNLLELTNLYSTFANGGDYRPYHLLADDTSSAHRALFEPATCFLVTEILSELRRPELPTVWDAAVNVPKVAWKTGTSLGKRDAWSIGYDPDFTIGVWIGNFNGKGNSSIVGAEVAAPVLFEIFEAIRSTKSTNWFLQPNSISHRQVCSISGMPATDRCASTTDEMYIDGVSPTHPCTMHELILVDKKTHQRLCNHCRTGHDYSEEVVTRWPTNIATWMGRNGYRIDPIPEHDPHCTQVAAGDAPVIVSPTDNSEFRLSEDVRVEFQKILLDASVSNETQKIFWFLDRKLIFSGSPDEKFFIAPKPGVHQLICMDDAGRSTEVTMKVKE